MVLGGMAWITTANTLSVSAQLALPNWVRARGMSIYQMSIMGATAAGAALWGQVASLTDVHTSLGIAAVSGGIVMAVVQHLAADRSIEEDLSPLTRLQGPHRPHAARGRACGRHHRILHPPARAPPEFRAVMQESRRSRLRQGALDWQLLHDISNPTRYVERIEDESWTEHLRRFDRVTASDVALRERKLAFHTGDAPAQGDAVDGRAVSLRLHAQGPKPHWTRLTAWGGIRRGSRPHRSEVV